jgi:hypothetical protein
MAKQVIGIGSVANDGTGDTIRAAFDKCNDNFTELYTDDAGDVNSITATAPIERDSATGAVTISLADNGVTLAKMAGIVRGKFIYGDASGDPAYLAAGANGKLLVADANGDPSWTTVSGDVTISAGAVTIANDAVTHDKLENRYTASVSISTYTGSVSFDWSAGCIFVMGSGLTGSFTVNMSNYKKGQVITIHALTGSETVTLDTATGSGQVYNKVGGVDYDGSTNNQIQIECIDDDATPIFNYQVGTYTSDPTPS